jgi:hypothetical protein
MRILRIVCNADHVSNIPLGELSSEKKKKMEGSLKFYLPSAVSVPMKAYPTIPTFKKKSLNMFFMPNPIHTSLRCI